MSAIEDVAAERRRQIEVEGWDADHDDGHALARGAHRPSGLAYAAACYALGEAEIGRARLQPGVRLWPWDMKWWKPVDPRRNLVKAGALIIAEIERLDRAESAREPASRGEAENNQTEVSK